MSKTGKCKKIRLLQIQVSSGYSGSNSILSARLYRDLSITQMTSKSVLGISLLFVGKLANNPLLASFPASISEISSDFSFATELC